MTAEVVWEFERRIKASRFPTDGDSLLPAPADPSEVLDLGLEVVCRRRKLGFTGLGGETLELFDQVSEILTARHHLHEAVERQLFLAEVSLRATAAEGSRNDRRPGMRGSGCA